MRTRKGRWLPWLLWIGALIPRLTAVGRYITPDELIWVYRSVLFREALRHGAWTDTLVSGHPGVVTAWLGTIGISLQTWLHPPSRSTYTWLTQLAWWAPDNVAAFQQLAQFLTAGRLLAALVNSSGVVVAYLLVRRLWNGRVGLLFALLLAFDPFLAGLSGLLHVDGLMATFAMLSLLALMVWLKPEAPPRQQPQMLVVAAACAALALLTKSPSILLLPVTFLFMGLQVLRIVLNERKPVWPAVRQLAGAAALWIFVLLLFVLLLFPALWAGPQSVWALLSGNASRHIEEALRPTFFLGNVAFDHGPLFYPVVLLFRLGPIPFLGLLVAILLWVKRPFRFPSRSLPPWLALTWSLLYVVGISFAAKKFDRYMLPVIPMLVLLAALAWRAHWPEVRRYRHLLWGGLLGVQLAYLLLNLPFPMAAYNPLLGGARVAQQALPVGWGEGISVAGTWLEQNVAPTEGTTAVSGIAPALAPFFAGETLLQTQDAAARADFVIVTLADRQTEPERVGAWTADLELLHIIRFGGLDQTWIYRQSDPVAAQPVVATRQEPLYYGDKVQLWGVAATATEDRVRVGVRWELAQPVQERFIVQLALRDELGHRWSGMETALLNDVYFYPEHWAPGEQPVLWYELPLPPGTPPATYRVEIAMFAEGSGAQLPVLGADGRFLGTAPALIGQQVPVAKEIPASSELDIPMPLVRPIADGLQLLGHDPLPQSVLTGDSVILTLYWQATDALPSTQKVMLTWEGEEQSESMQVPLSRYDPGLWRPGEILQEKYSLVLPPDLPGGRYRLRLENEILGSVEAVATDRLFALPENVPLLLEYHFGGNVSLLGIVPPEPVAPGEQVRLTLYWEVAEPPQELITAFVHVLGETGSNVTQSDHWPGGLPSTTWAAGQVLADEVTMDVPAELPPGEYRVWVVLYSAANGLRLPAADSAGTAVADDRVLLPVPLVISD